MQYTGRFQVAFRGPVGVMQTLPDTVDTWGHLLSENYMNEDVREEINEVAGILCRKADTLAQKCEDEIVVVVWEHLSPLALVLLDCINGIAKAYPVLEIAVVLELNFSVSDSVGYYSYYSAAGEDTICPAAHPEIQIVLDLTGENIGVRALCGKNQMDAKGPSQAG